jgi:hypothetical protein
LPDKQTGLVLSEVFQYGHRCADIDRSRGSTPVSSHLCPPELQTAYKRFSALLRYPRTTSSERRAPWSKFAARNITGAVPITELVRRISKEENTDKRGRRRSILHPICAISRTSLYNMLLILLSVIVTVTIVAVSMIRHRDSFQSFSGAEIVGGDSSVARARSEQFAVAGPMKQLIVVLPDGTIVTPRAMGRV